MLAFTRFQYERYDQYSYGKKSILDIGYWILDAGMNFHRGTCIGVTYEFIIMCVKIPARENTCM